MANSVIKETQLARRKCPHVRQCLIALRYLQNHLGVDVGADVRLVPVVYTKPDQRGTYDPIKRVATACANLKSGPDMLPNSFTFFLVIDAMKAKSFRTVSLSL